jgi:putative zinc finger/helix-turn-helix YgiT family protein
MTLVKEQRTMEFRKVPFEIVFHSYRCEDSGEQFTSTELDELNMNQVYNQYRDKFNIPFPDEITNIRQKYGVSAAKMSEILGLGVNGYRQYEAGEMPSVSNAKLIQMAGDPEIFRKMVELCESLDDKAKRTLLQKVDHLIDSRNRDEFDLKLKDYLLGSHLADIYSGYRNPNYDKFAEMVVFFSHKLRPYKTKLNKLLFYADFLMFKKSCFSISGVRYVAIDRGPVPNNFNSVFEFLLNSGIVDVQYTQFPQGYTGEQFVGKCDRPFDASFFTDDELATMDQVAAAFRDVSAVDIVKLSHLEDAWTQNQADKKPISYRYAFDLVNL